MKFESATTDDEVQLILVPSKPTLQRDNGILSIAHDGNVVKGMVRREDGALVFTLVPRAKEPYIVVKPE